MKLQTILKNHFDEKITHYVLPRGRHTIVKVADFFIEQGGLDHEWGKAWKPVCAESIFEAREIGSKMEPISDIWKKVE